jgi:hypothetical protein
VRHDEERAAQPCTAEVGFIEALIAKSGPTKIRLLQFSPRQHSAIELGAAHVSLMQAGAPQQRFGAPRRPEPGYRGLAGRWATFLCILDYITQSPQGGPQMLVGAKSGAACMVKLVARLPLDLFGRAPKFIVVGVAATFAHFLTLSFLVEIMARRRDTAAFHLGTPEIRTA